LFPLNLSWFKDKKMKLKPPNQRFYSLVFIRFLPVYTILINDYCMVSGNWTAEKQKTIF